MIPAAHQLSDYRVLRDDRGRRVYAASCACMETGVEMVTATLPALWSMYQMHLDAVRAMSQANHPSRRTP